MARNPTLKVFRTAIGFHDAYVAAPSKKAALAAWGAKSDLFTRGAAEVVTDPALGEAALAAPGTVIKVSRGTAAEQLAALGKGAEPARKPKAGAMATPAAKPSPRPSRSTLDSADASLAALEQHHRDQSAALDREEQALRKRQATLRATQGRERAAVAEKRDVAQAAYDRAIEKWRDS